jgi:hypothetical protein
MRGIFPLLFLAMATQVNADTLNLIFRHYTHEGVITSNPRNLEVSSGSSTLLGKPDKGGWQHWLIETSKHPIRVALINSGDSVFLEIDIHKNHRNGALKTIVINRLQSGTKKQMLKVNEFTCRWTGSIAYPIEYQFNNPLDGQKLTLKSLRCSANSDSMKLVLDVLSDSVMLIRCGVNDAFFMKYHLSSSGYLIRGQTNYTCNEFSNELERRLYVLLIDPTTRIRFDYAGGNFLLMEGNCVWEFKF